MIFPWNEFFLSTQRDYLHKEEHVAGAHGVEARYPFLDPRVVQEYIWLSPDAWFASKVVHQFVCHAKSFLLLHGNAASYYFLYFSELKEVKNREYKAPLHDAFEGWGYPFEKRKKTGFAAKANLVSDDSSLLWRYNNHPQVPCGPYAAATGNTISLCIPRSDGLHCEVKCSDDRPPRSNTLRCGHRGVWVGNIECQHSADLTDGHASFVPTLWPKDGPQPPIVMERS